MDYLVYNLKMLGTRDDTLLDERERIMAQSRGKEFVLSRSLLKEELSRRTGFQVRDIHFTLSSKGKPIWPPQPFNLSHSRHCLCLAFHHQAVGVDVEFLSPRPFARLARRVMSPEQWERFQERGCQQDEFYACWCAAEALVKWAGCSVWQAQRFPFLYVEGRIVPQFRDAPQIQLFTPMEGFCGAIVFQE